MTKGTVFGILIAVVVVLLIVVGFKNQGGELSGVYNQVTTEFREGLKAGTSNQFVVSNTGDVTADDLTVDRISQSGTGTTTLQINTTTSGRGGCIELEGTTGTTTRIYANPASEALIVEHGSCE